MKTEPVILSEVEGSGVMVCIVARDFSTPLHFARNDCVARATR